MKTLKQKRKKLRTKITKKANSWRLGDSIIIRHSVNYGMSFYF